MKAHTSLLDRPRNDEMCPTGYHVVQGHPRVCKSGAESWVRAHLRINRGGLPEALLKENIWYLYWNSKNSYGKLKSVFGFEKRDEFDEIIQFWLDFWGKQGHKFEIDPLLVKVIIAKESSFNPKARPPNRNSTARGLMQVLGHARSVMAGNFDKNNYREVKRDYLQLSQEDTQDPVCGIAAGTRWLVHKYEQLPVADRKSWNAIRDYHSRNKMGDEYAKDVFERYEKSRK